MVNPFIIRYSIVVTSTWTDYLPKILSTSKCREWREWTEQNFFLKLKKICYLQSHALNPILCILLMNASSNRKLMRLRLKLLRGTILNIYPYDIRAHIHMNWVFWMLSLFAYVYFQMLNEPFYGKRHILDNVRSFRLYGHSLLMVSNNRPYIYII